MTRVLTYDTTLRDGTQGEGIAFSVSDKLRIAERLDHFGIDFIEGGWPGSNPRDAAFFAEAARRTWKHARLAAFGSTRRPRTRAAEEPQVRALLDAATPVVTVVGKSWLLHVTEVLRTTAEENLAMIEDTVRFLAEAGREVIYDAEHFYDGFVADAEYALATLAAAARGGATCLTLCDTNGGQMTTAFARTTAEVLGRFPQTRIGVHCHNDAGLGVALSLAGVEAGATLVQGTINGIGERVGNADLVTILANLALKFGAQMTCAAQLPRLRELAHFVDEMANRSPARNAPYVGDSAFAHKGGLHADATKKVAHSYQHIDPAVVGNRARILISDMAGKGSLELKARELGFAFDPAQPEVRRLLDRVKQLEHEGYEYEAADASFELLLERTLRDHQPFFVFESYRVIVERRGDDLVAEATVKLRIAGELVHTVAEMSGPVAALDRAMRLALERYFPAVADVRLRDFKVRLLDSRQGASERIRVLVESGDGESNWGTVGVSDNIIEASWEALQDSFAFRLLRDERRRAAASSGA